jgi:MIP family channel proteins
VNAPNCPVNPVPGTLAAEAAGTFMLTFADTATVLAVHQLQKGSTGATALDDLTIGAAFAFGLVAAVYAVAGLSGAHLNPAITAGLAAAGRFPWRMVPGYVAAQMTGALLAGLANWVIFPHLREPLILGSTHPGPGIAWWTAGFTEFVITLILMVVVMATAVHERAPGGAAQAGVAIGLWAGAAVFLALPVSGGSLNPARTLGPDIVAMEFPYWWIYVAGPVLGGMAGAALWELVLNQGRQPAAGQASGLSHRLPSNRPLAADGTLQQGRVYGGRFTVDGGPADCSMARSAPSKPGSCRPRLAEPRRLLHKASGLASPACEGGGGPLSVRG